ncbi:hypothetical protein ASPZODRAFT_147983 [Penicilliopsis zonata CBS 506.65]|uniref:Haloacid dehalogenase, type II n=1 Tax=Penicilliopsis zonata CBS 506.65 TaxID=1073090 RepID=A0A1L9STN0_9EURO|nr:hypothetical protein ASPZODRAFT_147983 [Penicilliopsis zonata CBS 506.65]OJJ50471.1 hypothetical protein ASPZODRAFT_147983 [Penicilliopsis zonata CBS 506.65]
MPIRQPLRVLFFDVFGTVVSWRPSVANALSEATRHALRATAAEARQVASAMTAADWQCFAEQWRRMYSRFTRSFDPARDTFISVDQHHYESLRRLLVEWKLAPLFSEEGMQELALCWHRLEPWADSVAGLHALNRRFATSTLSNGNLSLLRDLQQFGGLPFTYLASAEQFGAYKPAPQVYLGATRALGTPPAQCALVAAHLHDLQAARAQGLQTIFVERAGEERPLRGAERATAQASVDLWIDEGQGGFLEVAKRLL